MSNPDQMSIDALEPPKTGGVNQEPSDQTHKKHHQKDNLFDDIRFGGQNPTAILRDLDSASVAIYQFELAST
jgi:hypothetical protein